MARKPEAPPPCAPRERAPPGTPLYVHLPFCAAKCHYCDFYSVAAEGHDLAGLVASILREAEAFAPTAPRTVFVGGGTPSLLAVPELASLFDGLDHLTGFRTSAHEVTVECNPESLDRAKARSLLDLGATRLSIGIQALDDAALELFGRVHDAAAGLRAYEAARAAGAREVNVDLMYAWPGQSLEAWLRDLDRVLDLGPDHLSAYNLTFEEDTAFRRWLDEGVLRRATEEVELAFFESTREHLQLRGWSPYEISNFARNGLRCTHNVNYWHNGPYLGLGPSAVSRIGPARWGNVRSVGDYLRRIQEDRDARTWEERPDPSARLRETWWLGLRLSEGLSAEEARARSAFAAAVDPTETVVAELVAAGLLAQTDGRYALSARGLPLADWVARRFLDAP